MQFAYFGSREWNRIVQMTMRFYFLSRQKGKRSRHFEKTALRLNFSNMNQQKSKRIESLPDSIRGKLGTKSRLELCKILNRFPIQNRRDQTRQRVSAGIAHPRSNKERKPPPRRRSDRQAGNNAALRTMQDFESLPDSKSPRPSAAAIVRGHRPQKVGPVEGFFFANVVYAFAD